MYQSKGKPAVVDDARESTERRPTSVLWMLAGTLVGGVAGYLVLWLTARSLGAAEYAVFGVFWSALYLIVGVLFGLQQEATRAASASASVSASASGSPEGPAGASAVGAARRGSSLWVLATASGLLVIAVAIGTAVWWAPESFGTAHSDLSIPVAIGSGLSAVVAVASGLFAGHRRWLLLGVIIAADGVLRLAAVGVATDFGAGTEVLAWAVVAPYVIVIVGCFAIGGRRLIRDGRVDVSFRRLAANSVQTVVAASATALLINGFPLVLALVEASDDATLLGALIFAITLTRAPLLVPLTALQSYLVTAFGAARREAPRLLARWSAIVVGVAVVLAAIAWLAGEWALDAFVGADFALPGSLLAGLVVSSGCIGMLCVTGPAVLARSLHTAYALGWVIASATTIALLFLPLTIEASVPLALAVGPLVGVAVHLGLLRWSGSAR
ncbi:hypothetical protein [Agromyces larvae]|uniref:Polysaccharide biosynthesis protein n=1 Tax=Agromyces larvae TaxID=2929802 RepID=A0ABY4BZG3_9MICO|nr:hypothetical protein [Agromyces larvae]UOE44509.1 hypothetical protein MTO99_01570 [Agromyces larvae]